MRLSVTILVFLEFSFDSVAVLLFLVGVAHARLTWFSGFSFSLTDHTIRFFCVCRDGYSVIHERNDHLI